MSEINNSLYDALFLDDNEDDDPGLMRINELYDHLDFQEMSKYIDLKSHNNKFSTLNSDLLSFLQLNIRSFKKNKSELEAILESLMLPPDVIAISETWLTSDSSHYANLHGYSGYHVVRDSPYGGASIFVRDGLVTQFVESFSFVNQDIEI